MDRQLTGFSPPNFRIQTSRILSAQQITASINSGAPILVGISPQGLPFPPGLGFSEHAVVIEGYLTDSNGINLIVDDPFDYLQNGMIPFYLQAGGTTRQPGQYVISYQVFVQILHYGNSITFT
jgi:hypothetical protein